MAVWYLVANAAMLVLSGALGWRSRRAGWTRIGPWIGRAVGLAVRVFLHGHPEVEQHLLALSDDYLYFATWEGPLVAFVAVALAARLRTQSVRRLALAALVLLTPWLLWYNVVLCLQPWYAMPGRLHDGAVYRQGTDYSCGPAAGLTLLRAAGVEASEGEMANLCLLRPGKGVSELELCRGLNVALRQRHRRATIRRAAPDELDSLPTPFLARTQRHGGAPHCVAVLAVRDDEVVVADPAQGRFVCARDDLLSEWTGLAITLDPASPQAPRGRP